MYETDLIFDYAKEPRRDILFIDCKSFYASVECVLRGLNPLEAKLVVMSYPSEDPAQRGSGLILASSPAAKKAFGISNVSRARDLPFPYPKDLIIAPPQMRLYMQKNQEINGIYRRYVDESNFNCYSVDESCLDVTGSLGLFKCASAYDLAKLIQKEVGQQTGIYTTVGIGDNPLLAKLAMNEAKHRKNMIAEWRYEDVPEKVWQIKDLTDFWGIANRTAKRLNNLNIFSIKDLAHANYYRLKSAMGVMGAQLYAHAWGIDRSFLGEKINSSGARSIGNSQVLNKDYVRRAEIIIVIREMADQVATRLRRAGAKARCASLWIGYSLGFTDRFGASGFKQQMKIPATDSSKELAGHLLRIFDKHYNGQDIRHVAVNTSMLLFTDTLQLDLFQDPDEQIKEQKLDLVKDKIRKKYGFKSIVYATSLMEGGRAIERSSLVNGHAGGMAGIEGVVGERNAAEK